MTQLKEANALWAEFVLVAFHPRYWDYLDWKDRFAKADYPSAQLTVAILGRSFTSAVSRGENKGRILDHDFVVLANTTVSGQSGSTGFTWEGDLPHLSIKADRYAVAAWVSVGGKQRTI